MIPDTRWEAGRDLDALVAEKVMGWVWRRPKDVRPGWVCFADLLAPDAGPDGRIIVASDDPDLAKCRRGSNSIPNYSSSISSAWEVVDLLRSKGWALALMDFRTYYMARFAKVDLDEMEQAEGQTPCLAICFASLKALSDKVLPPLEGG